MERAFCDIKRETERFGKNGKYEAKKICLIESESLISIEE
jgi:hypothetical protein